MVNRVSGIILLLAVSSWYVIGFRLHEKKNGEPDIELIRYNG